MNVDHATRPAGRWGHRLPYGVYLLAFSLFAMGSAEFLLAGVLPAVAADIGVSLATAGGLLAIGGISAGFFLLPGVVGPEYLSFHDGLDAGTMAKVAEAVQNQPTTQIGGLLFILAITFGLLLLGIALWRSRVAPTWMGIALAVGGFTHPFMPTHTAAGVGLIVAAIGFSGASIALLRTPNDAFDLPPVQR